MTKNVAMTMTAKRRIRYSRVNTAGIQSQHDSRGEHKHDSRVKEDALSFLNVCRRESRSAMRKKRDDIIHII